MKKLEVSDNLYEMIQILRRDVLEKTHTDLKDDMIIYCAIREALEKRGLYD